MPKTIGKNLNLCFTKIKEPQQDQSRPLPLNSTNTTSSLVKNFNTLYDPSASDNSPSNSKSSPDISSSESDAETATPDFSTVFASHRFFFSSPGRSNSIVESSSSLSSSSMSSPPPTANSKMTTELESVIGGGVAIPTFSPDPYMDFRRSMQEMVESRDLVDVRANWDYLHELLMCYLALNPKSTHKFIVTAFADLLLTLMPSPPPDGDPR